MALLCLLGVLVHATTNQVDMAANEKGNVPLAATEAEQRFQAAEEDWEMSNNPLHTLQRPPESSCELPELDPESMSSWEEFAPATGQCLDDIWLDQLGELGLSPEPAEYQVTEEGPSDVEAAPDSMILGYYELNTITIVHEHVSTIASDIPGGDQEGVWTALMGHEYAHYIQDHTGILEHSHEAGLEADQDEDEMLRRVELQAECIAGATLQASGRYSETDMGAINQTLNGGGDSVTHGSAANRHDWMMRGWNMTSLADCDTFAADASEVG